MMSGVSTLGFRPPIAVHLAHHDAAIRQAMTDDLAATGIHIVGQCGEGHQALEQILALVPDVALVAIDLPGVDGIEICTQLRREIPSCRVLIVAPNDDHPRVVDGLAAGAYGCHLTDAPAVTLVRAIRGTMRGESLPTARWAARILEDYESLASAEQERVVPVPRMTATEKEVLVRLADGTSITDIAKAHDVTAHMVRLHAGYAIIKLYRALSDELLVARPSAPTPF